MKALGKPILCLAPMADVTDSAFRYVIAKHSKNITPHEKSQGAPLTPFVIWTEFVSADGLVLAHEEGKKKLLKDLEYSEIERPIVAQLFGSRPENMHKAAKLVASLGFDGLDINMGCPDKSIEKQGAGAAMIKNPQLAREIIRAAKAGVLEYAQESGKVAIPVSVKTRLGYNKDELEDWLPELLAEEPAVITIHARTRKEMSKVPARWERIKRAVEIRDAFYSEKVVSEKTGTLIFGNGDVESVADAIQKAEATDCDGVMLGRAIFGNPFLFANRLPTQREQLGALAEHIRLFEKNLGGVKSFAVMRKHFKAYLAGIENSARLKDDLLQAENAEEALGILEKFEL